MPHWWATKLRQTRSHLFGRVSAAERASVATWLTPSQLELFDRMPRADRRHGLDVVAWLQAHGAGEDAELLGAGLLHDAGKGRSVRLPHRVAWSLGQAYGPWVWRLARPLPTFGRALERLRHHAELSAAIAERAGCSPRIVELIRCQDEPRDEAGRLLHAADEAS